MRAIAKRFEVSLKVVYRKDFDRQINAAIKTGTRSSFQTEIPRVIAKWGPTALHVISAQPNSKCPTRRIARGK